MRKYMYEGIDPDKPYFHRHRHVSSIPTMVVVALLYCRLFLGNFKGSVLLTLASKQYRTRVTYG